MNSNTTFTAKWAFRVQIKQPAAKKPIAHTPNIAKPPDSRRDCSSRSQTFSHTAPFEEGCTMAMTMNGVYQLPVSRETVWAKLKDRPRCAVQRRETTKHHVARGGAPSALLARSF